MHTLHVPLTESGSKTNGACVIICLSITVLPSLGYGELCLTKSILHVSPTYSNNTSQATGGTSRSRWRKERNQKKAPPWAMTEGWWTPFRGQKKLNTQFTKLNHTSVKSHFYCAGFHCLPTLPTQTLLPCDARMDLAGHHWPTVHRSNFPLAKSIDLASNALDVERTNQIDKMTCDMTYDNWHFEFSLKSQKADLIQWCICLLFVSCCFEIKDQFSNFRYKKVGHQYFSLISHRWHAKQEKSQIV